MVMDRRQFLTSAAGAALAGGSTLAPSTRALAQSSSAKTLTFGQSTSILTLDPARGSFTGYPAGYEAALCLYDRLLDFDANMKIVPQLAQSYEMSKDLKSCTLKLRTGVKFHDGTAFDAAAARANLERLMDKERNATNRPLWDPIQSLDAPDATTIVIHTRAPFSQLPNSLAHGSGAMVSPAAIQKFGDTGIAQNPVGAGPYILDSFRPGQELTLKAFEGYWGEKAGAERLVFRFIAEPATRISALRTGGVDLIDSVPVQLVQQLASDPKIEILRRPGLRPMGFIINMTRAPLQDVRVRQALNLAVPVQTIAERVFFGFAKAPNSPLAFDTVGHKAISQLTFNQPEARKLLADAGYKAGSGGIVEKDGKPLSLALFTPEGLFPGDVGVTEIVAASLKQVGVDTVITKIERGAYWDHIRQDKANLKWDLAMFGFNPSNASGLYHLESLFKSNKDDNAKPDVWNAGRYRSEKVDALLAQANSDPDAAKQAEFLAQAQKAIWDDAPYLWLQINENVTAVRKGVAGVEVWPIVFTCLRRAKA